MEKDSVLMLCMAGISGFIFADITKPTGFHILARVPDICSQKGLTPFLLFYKKL
jgi:hypothetical protein